MNHLNQKNFYEFYEALRSFQADPGVKAIVLRSAKTDCFIAGADIKWVVIIVDVDDDDDDDDDDGDGDIDDDVDDDGTDGDIDDVDETLKVLF